MNLGQSYNPVPGTWGMLQQDNPTMNPQDYPLSNGEFQTPDGEVHKTTQPPSLLKPMLMVAGGLLAFNLLS